MGGAVAEDQYGAGELDHLLTRTRTMFDSLAVGARPDAAAEQEEPAEARGTGESAAGQVRVTVVAPGEIGSLRLEPTALRLGSDELADRVTAAVNAALADYRARAGAMAAVVPDGLAGQLRDLHEESVRGMAAFADAMNDALAQIRRGGR